MKIIGVTGSSGSGKSLLCEAFKSLGAYVLDADIIAREIVKKDMPAIFEITKEFGEEILKDDKTLNRKKLADIVFNDKEKLLKLNKITHKYIVDKIFKKINENKNAYSLAVIDAAVLIESGLTDTCDEVICVLSPFDKKVERIIKRDNISKKQAEERLKSQKTDDEYKKYASIVINNDGDENFLKAEAEKIYKKLIG